MCVYIIYIIYIYTNNNIISTDPTHDPVSSDLLARPSPRSLAPKSTCIGTPDGSRYSTDLWPLFHVDVRMERSSSVTVTHFLRM